MSTRSWIALLVCAAAAAGCTPTQVTEVASTKPAVELRAMQTRLFDTPDQTKTLRAVIATCQDLGYTLEKVEPTAGTVSAVKLNRLHVTATVMPRGTAQMAVRANALIMMPGLKNTQVDDPGFYQRDFFEPLAKAMVLEAHPEPTEAAALPAAPQSPAP